MGRLDSGLAIAGYTNGLFGDWVGQVGVRFGLRFRFPHLCFHERTGVGLSWGTVGSQFLDSSDELTIRGETTVFYKVSIYPGQRQPIGISHVGAAHALENYVGVARSFCGE